MPSERSSLELLHVRRSVSAAAVCGPEELCGGGCPLQQACPSLTSGPRPVVSAASALPPTPRPTPQSNLLPLHRLPMAMLPGVVLLFVSSGARAAALSAQQLARTQIVTAAQWCP